MKTSKPALRVPRSRPTRLSHGRKGTIGNHGTCDVCAQKLQRRHNKRWCPDCNAVYDVPRGESHD